MTWTILALVLAFGPAAGAVSESDAGTVAAPAVHTVAAATFGTVDPADLERIVQRAEQMAPLTSLLIAQGGELLVEKYFRGMRADRSVNVKSVSKTLLSPLIGIAIRDGLIEGTDQPIAELLPAYFEGNRGAELDPRKREIKLHHLLSMTAGIETTSFRNYGAWVSSRDWAWDALRRPMECSPGRCWEYSTGNTHLLSVILTEASGKSTRQYARDAFFGKLGIPVHEWDRDPQGRYLGGNNMAMRPRDLLKFGQLFLDGGQFEGEQLVPWEWILASWQPNGESPWNGHRYGYLWWTESWGREQAYFAWGYGGQYVVLVPRLELVAVVTSSLANRRRRHTRDLRNFFDDLVVRTFSEAAAGS